ncbi:hypothetical protein ACODNH_00070 (plasmid) [Haloarcula sp. NS06]|uniref:hypothetical protein n=1 Tax=Haloarcula sp. NS06 TaxID=3409688 RepID=UPI003DA7A2FB
MDSNLDYWKVAEQTLTNDEPDDSPVMSFVASTFELSDDFTTLEADLAEHELGRQGLGSNGLENLDERFKTLTARYAAVQRVVSDPQKLAGHSSTSDDVDEDDITRLRSAIHGSGDLDRVLNQTRDTQTRVGNDITAKRSHLTTMRGAFDLPSFPLSLLPPP